MPFSLTQTFSSSGEFFFSTSTTQILTGTTGFASPINAIASTGFFGAPMISSQILVQATSLSSFTAVTATSGADQVLYQVTANGQPYYYTAGLSTNSWASASTSNGALNASPSSSINAASTSFFSSLNLTGCANIGINAFLYSSSGLPGPMQSYSSSSINLTSPQLTSLTLGYTSLLDPAANPPTVQIYAYLSDLFGGTIAPTSSQPVTLYVGSDRGFFYGNKFIEPFTKASTFNSLGYAAVSVIETATPGKELQFWISYYESKSLKMVKFNNAIVPNTATQSLSKLTTIRVQDFG